MSVGAGTAGRITERELTAAWMSLLGGADAIGGADLELWRTMGRWVSRSSDEIAGRLRSSVRLLRVLASTFGAPSPEPRFLGGMARAAMQLTSNGPQAGHSMTGLNLVVRTKMNDFLMSDADREILNKMGGWGDADIARHAQREQLQQEARMERLRRRQEQRAQKPGEWTLSDAAGAIGDAVGGAIGSGGADDVMHIPEMAYKRGSINFGVGRRVNGTMKYIIDFGGWFMDDDAAGYTAGRDFLIKMHSFEWLFQAIAGLTIPAVEEEE